MRKISKLAARAFIEGENFRKDNTSVRVHATIQGKRKEMRLHGNVIATQEIIDSPHGPWHKRLHITLAGWPTVTTRERLNTLLTESNIKQGIWQHKFDQYYGTHDNCKMIESGDWIEVVHYWGE